MMTAEALHAIRSAETAVRRERRSWTISIWSGRALLLIGLLVLWQALSGTVIDETFISRPTSIAAAWWKLVESGELPNALRITITEFLIGMVAGTITGVVVAFALTQVGWAYRILEPYVLAVYAIPKVALAPLFVLWFGIDLLPKVVLTAMIAFFLVFMNTVAGVRSVDRQMIGTLRVMGARTPQLYRLVLLPHAMPFVLTAIRISIPTAMVGAVLGELLGGGGGVGYLIYQASNYLDTAQIFACITTLAASVIAFRLLLHPLETRLGRSELGVEKRGSGI